MGKRTHRPLPVHLTWRERDAILDTARASHPRGVTWGALRNTAVLAVGLYAGLRVSEIVGLDRDDVDLADLTVKIRHGKGDKAREISLHEKAADALAAYLDTRNDGCPALFTSRRGGRLSVDAVQALVASLARDTGLAKKVSPHKLRHTFATLLLDAGQDLRVIQELLGHASITTTTIYTHVSQVRMRRAVDAL